MPGIGGTFDDSDDFNDFLEHVFNKATNFEADNWADIDSFDTIHESMDAVIEACKILFNAGFPLEGHSRESFEINDKLKYYAKTSSDLEWGWWRKDKRIPLEYSDGKWIGNNSPFLIGTYLHRGAGIIKHNYSQIPEPIKLRSVSFEQEGVSAFMGVATAGELDSICSVPWMDPKMKSKDFADSILNSQMDTNKWQRMIDHDRVDNIRNFAETEGHNLFNPVLLYVDSRDVDISDPEGDGNEKTIAVPFTFLEQSYGKYTDYFPAPEHRDNRPVWIIDGQHRIRGFGSSKRGSKMQIPFVLLIGDNNPKTVANIALLFTQINTKSEPLDDLHKIYLNYQFGIGDYEFSVDANNDRILGHSNLPQPTDGGRPHRRSFELALYLAAHSNSPLLDCITFQKPPGQSISNKMVTDSKKFISNTKSWFSSIYNDPKLDSIYNDEVLNFFKAFKSLCDSWPQGNTKWHVGRANNKQFLQHRGPFPVLLHTHRLCVERIVNRDSNISRPISSEVFQEEMRPLQWVDWDARALKHSKLNGQTNDNIRHLNLWIKRAIENGESYAAEEILSSEIQSEPGKGLLAPPKATAPWKTSSNNFPDMQSLVLVVKEPEHCLRVDWDVEAGDGEKYTELSIPSDAFDKDNADNSRISIKSPWLSGERFLRVRAKFTNGIGSTYSQWLDFQHPGETN